MTHPIIPELGGAPGQRHVEAYITAHPGCSTRDIADALDMNTQLVGMNTTRLRNKGLVRAEKPDKLLRWYIGCDDQWSEETPERLIVRQKVVKEWEAPAVPPQSWLSALG